MTLPSIITTDNSAPIDYAYLRLWHIVREAFPEHTVTATNDMQRWADAEAHARLLVEKYTLLARFVAETKLTDVFEAWSKTL